MISQGPSLPCIQVQLGPPGKASPWATSYHRARFPWILPDPCSSNSNLSDVWICAATSIELSQRRLTISIYGEGSCLPATLHILVSKKVRNKRLSEKYLWASWCLRMLNFWKGVQFEDTKALWESLLGPQSSNCSHWTLCCTGSARRAKEKAGVPKACGSLGSPCTHCHHLAFWEAFLWL